MNRRNYQRELERLLVKLEQEERVPTLFLHSCCAPCSSYCLEYLAKYFKITVFYYNPNIYPDSEYANRVEEQERLIREFNEEKIGYPIRMVKADFHPEEYYSAIKGVEQTPEGGPRCVACFKLRLGEAARMAKEGDYDYYTTTLTISRQKDAVLLNAIGEEMGELHGVKFLNSEFKKKNGNERSIELSKEHNLYRQEYCGCVYSWLKYQKREENKVI